MLRHRFALAAAPVLVAGCALVPPAPLADVPQTASSGAATDQRMTETRLRAVELALPEFEHWLPDKDLPEGSIGEDRFGIGVIVFVAVDGAGHVVDAAGGPIHWYLRTPGDWIARPGPFDVEDLRPLETAAVAGVLTSRFAPPREGDVRPGDIYRGRVEVRWEVTEGKPLIGGTARIAPGPEHDTGLLAEADQVAVIPPRLLQRVNPVYPEEALALKARGTVILQALIDDQGTVSRVKVLKTTGAAATLPSLARSALQALKQWTYEPATRNGRPASVYFTVTIEFAPD
jgi:TonB family protein